MPYDLSGLKLVTSNQRKLEEIRSFGIEGLEIEAGRDLPEVDGTPDEIIFYKALEAGRNRIVEDSVMYVDGAPMIDARWRIGDAENWAGKQARWESRFGINRVDVIEIYFGAVDGIYTTPRVLIGEYDPYFLIPEEGKTLSELAVEGRKEPYSARKRAADNLCAGNTHLVSRTTDLALWTGAFQSPITP